MLRKLNFEYKKGQHTFNGCRPFITVPSLKNGEVVKRSNHTDKIPLNDAYQGEGNTHKGESNGGDNGTPEHMTVGFLGRNTTDGGHS